MPEDEDIEEIGDISVPPELLELHIELEVAGMSADEFQEVYGEAGNQS